MKTLVLIDSNAIIHRAYHALPKNMATSKGEMTNAVYGYATTLVKILEDLHPDYIAASFDISRATFRLKQYAEYKATRVAADQELYDQIPLVRELLSVFEIPVYDKEGYEADDVIGTISDKFEERNPKQLYKDFNVYIVTGDKDAFQLVDGNINVYNLKHGLSSAQIVNRETIQKEFNLQPEDFIDLKALAGDPSDNIPGVPGIGPKTATNLLIKFDTLVKLYEKIEAKIPSSSPVIPDPKGTLGSEAGIQKLSANSNQTHGSPGTTLENTAGPEDDIIIEKVAKELEIKPRILRLLIQYKDQAFLSQSLATIYREVPIDFNLEDCKWGDYDREKVREFFGRMQFRSLLKRFGVLPSEEPKTKEAKEQKEKDEQLRLL
jgi:DNA polymerase-1